LYSAYRNDFDSAFAYRVLAEKNREVINYSDNSFLLSVQLAKSQTDEERNSAKSREGELMDETKRQKSIIMYTVLGVTLLLGAGIMLFRSFRKTKQLNEKINAINEEMRVQSEEIRVKNDEIMDGISYASIIQFAAMPSVAEMKHTFGDCLVYLSARNVVSGDFYWASEDVSGRYKLLAVGDCTGHGVPGAFMSMIGSQILTEIVADGITSPEKILTNQNRRIRKALKQETTANQDGMDMALCTIDKKTHLVEYSGAKNQLVVIQNGELTEYKADKQSIGGQQLYGDDFQYMKVAIQPDGNTWFYMFSDGYKDQFGGPNNTKFLIKNLRALLMQIHNEPPAKQREILNDTIET
jgi:serine phosphatase RsbU (regulator of sigma subunit)